MERSSAYELAGLGTRLIALFIDAIVLALISWVIGLVLGRAEIGGILGFLIGVTYQWYFLTQQNGQTPGKKIMGVRVIKVNGQPLQGMDAVIRYIGYYINSFFLMIGWIWAIFDENRQGWHDKLSGTYVIKA